MESFYLKFLVLYITLFISSSLIGQTYPPDVTSFNNGTMPSQPKPGYKQSITDETFGTIITRVSDKSAFGSTNRVNAHEYSCMEVWNCNASMMILKNGQYPDVVIDGNNYNMIGKYATPHGGTWSHIQPDIIFGVSGNNFVQFNISTNTTTIVKNFSGYTSLVFAGENHISNDDKYTCIFGYKGPSLYLISFDIANKSIIAEKYVGELAVGDTDPNGINAVQMSQKGNYILVIYKSAGDGLTQGVHLYDRNLKYIRFLFTQCGHCDQGIDENGDEVFVGQTSGEIGHGREIFKLRYSDNAKTVVLSEYKSSWTEHLSCRNFKRPGWCYMSDYQELYDTDRPNRKKLFALKLDGSQTVEFFGWSQRSDVIEYDRCAMICPSPDGSKVIFRSDWGNTAADAEVNAYVAKCSVLLNK